MNRRTLWLCLPLIAALALSSCSVDHAKDGGSAIVAPPSTGEAEWTVLYYGAGNTNDDVMTDTQSEVYTTVRELQDVYPSDRVRVAALFGSSATNSHCRFVDLGRDVRQTKSPVDSSSYQDWGTRDLSSADVLKQFVDSVLVRCPSQRYVLVIGGAGQNWRGACRDDVNGDGQVMSLSNLCSAIQTSSTVDGHPVRMDLVVWLTPGMGTIEVAYELRNLAGYMVATSSTRQQPGFLAANQWLLDLSLNPTMNAETLGRFVVSRMEQRAQVRQDTLCTYTLLDLSHIEPAAAALSDMASMMSPTLHETSGTLLRIQQAINDVRTDDSTSVDLGLLRENIGANPAFQVSGFADVSNRLDSALQQVIIERTSTRTAFGRVGLVTYLPLQPNASELTQYQSLKISRDQPGWSNLLAALGEGGSSMIQITGNVSWPGHDLLHVYLFLNTAQVGTPVIALTSDAILSDGTAPDNANFASSIALDGDSVASYLGLFEDLDNDHQLSAGDRYGYYHVTTPLRDWIMLHSGEPLDSVHVELSRTL